jgi:hypothetical protein
MIRPFRAFSFVLGLLASAPALSVAVNEKGDWPWNLKLHGWHDRAIAEDLGTGWFMNVGPTGLRARITHEHPEFLTIKYVFKKSPAAGLVNIDDIVVGANGKRLTVAHTFGRGSRGRGGWEGPMLDLSKLIEDSQGKDGKLELIIWPGGNKAGEKTVTLQIPAIGRFSPTWPFDCPRSDKLMIDLCDFLADEYKRAGKFESQVHTHSSAVLALMASGEDKYKPLIRQVMADYGKKRYSSNDGNGFPAWSYGHDGIVMGEYYLLTKDKSLLPAIESLNECLVAGQEPESGGYSHKPFPSIQQRIAAGGPKGYGAMAMPGGLAMVAMSLFREAGLDHAAPAYKRLHEAYLTSVTPSGAIDYGFKDWDHAVIVLADPKGSPKNAKEGVGYLCAEGLAGSGDYKIEWPTKADPRFRPTEWVGKEKATNHVYDMGGAKRLVVRNMPPDEPKKAYQQNDQPCDHFGRSGAGALAHSIGNGGNESWNHLSDLMAAGCAKSGKGLLDGHASTHIHVLWGSLGAALADEKDFRAYLEDIRWWMIMAQTHDGGFVIMPGRDYASTDHVYGTRNYPTACAALILSLKEKRLQITGAPRRNGDPGEAAAPKPRRLSPGNLTLLHESLITALAELSHSGQLKPLPMTLSKSASKVRLTGVGSAGKLAFVAVEGGKQESFVLADLGESDHALLARLVARLRPADQEAHARAGLYLEHSGETALAKEYYRRAGPEFSAKLERLFE